MTKKNPVWDSEDLNHARKLKDSQPMWRSVLLGGQTDLIDSMFQAGFTADYPVGDRNRSPLIDLALTVPSDPAHAEALAEAARTLVNAGATLNLPDSLGLVPADYALISPNPFIAREILLSTLRNETYKGLQNSYTPQLGVLFSMAAGNKEQAALHENLVDNAAEIRQSVKPESVKEDPLLLQQGQNLDYWRSFEAPDPKDMPKASKSMRMLFARIGMMNAQGNDWRAPAAKACSPEEIAETTSRFRYEQWRHARNFYL